MTVTTASTDSTSARAPRRRLARGPARPSYLRPTDVDALLHVVLALMSEMSSLRDRLDTHELLAAAGTVATPDAVEGHRLTAEQREQREQRRQAMLRRTLRVLLEEHEAGAPRAGARSEAPLDGDTDSLP